MTKGRNKALKRRALRKAEKRSTLAQDKMMGRVVRRGYGASIQSAGRLDIMATIDHSWADDGS